MRLAILVYEGEVKLESLDEAGIMTVKNLCKNMLAQIAQLPRCKIFVKGEQCALRAGHEGGHKWGNGD